MAKNKIDVLKYRGKNTVFFNTLGIKYLYRIYDWSKRCKRYTPRTLGNRYHAVKKVDNKLVGKNFKELREAKVWQEEGVLKEAPATESDKSMSFFQIKKMYFKKYKMDVRISSYETAIAKAKHTAYFDKLKMEKLTSKVIDCWLMQLKSVGALANQHQTRMHFKTELLILRRICIFYEEYICEEDVVYVNPVKKRHFKDCFVRKLEYQKKKDQEKQKFLSASEIRSFLNTFKNTYGGESNYYLLAFLQLRTGTRIGEAASIHFEDICFDTKRVHIHRNVCWSRAKGRKTFVSESTKTGLSRTIPILDPELLRALKAHALRSGRSRGLVFSLDKNGKKPLGFRAISYRYNKILKVIGSRWSGTHLSRNSFSTDFLEKTRDLRSLQGLLGHSTSRQTDHYAKMTQSTIKSGMEKYQAALALQFEDEKRAQSL